MLPSLLLEKISKGLDCFRNIRICRDPAGGVIPNRFDLQQRNLYRRIWRFASAPFPSKQNASLYVCSIRRECLDGKADDGTHANSFRKPLANEIVGISAKYVIR